MIIFTISIIFIMVIHAFNITIVLTDTTTATTNAATAIILLKKITKSNNHITYYNNYITKSDKKRCRNSKIAK